MVKYCTVAENVILHFHFHFQKKKKNHPKYVEKYGLSEKNGVGKEIMCRKVCLGAKKSM